MKENICKFIDDAVEEGLKTTRFIYECHPESVPFPYRTDRHMMFLCCNGEGEYRCNQKSYSIGVGSLFFAFEGEEFSIRSKEQLEYLYICFSGPRCRRLFYRFGIHNDNRVFPSLEGLVPVWKEGLMKSDPETVDLISESLLLQAFSRLHGYRAPESSVVDFVVEYLNENYSDCDLTLSRVAQKAGYHEKYLSHVFKKNFGVSFCEYLKLLRMKQAVFLLENGVTMVKNLAALTGYRDPMYFSKVFASVTGKSPREYLLDSKTKKQREAAAQSGGEKGGGR